MQKECPLCGEMMRLTARENIIRVPGSPKEVKEIIREWICHECDYFEEEEDSGVVVVPPPKP